ncbi:hypothetical protein M758_4G017000 [Ceratodon purpureus]|nr:hypothetical protein M758_4G017000 [Ceratodon purpureus]
MVVESSKIVLPLPIIQVPHSLKDVLDEFLGDTVEAPGLRSVTEFAAHQDENDCTPCDGEHHVGAERRQGSTAVETQLICKRSCPEHKEVMSPALWGALPKDLLQIVFAHLPLADFSRLRCLSEEWRDSIETPHSEFIQVCKAVISTHTNSFALISTDKDDMYGVFWVRVFDMKANRWHEFEFDSEKKYCVALVACDGGLVCLLSVVPDVEEEENEDEYDLPKPLLLTVWNPLTGEKYELPCLDHLDGLCPTMLQLVVDPQIMHYKVMVATKDIYEPKIDQQGAYIYDSQSDRWSQAEKSSRVMFGKYYSWPNTNMWSTETVVTRPCVFDFATSRLHTVKVKRQVEPWGRQNLLRPYAITAQDRLFVLDKFITDESFVEVFRILEYHADVNQSGRTNWLFKRVHSCGPSESAPRYSQDRVRLFALKEFLLVCVDSSFRHRKPRLWLYNVCTLEWRELPSLVKYKDIGQDDIMCELRPWYLLD